MKRVAVINGPNLNLLGTRQPEIYGLTTLEQLHAMVLPAAAKRQVTLEWHQSNHEGELVDLIQGLAARVDGAILNLGAYTHTSLALRDALLAAPLPFVEVHLSNLFARESLRHQSLMADLAIGIISGFGPGGYLLALQGLLEHLGCD